MRGSRWEGTGGRIVSSIPPSGLVSAVAPRGLSGDVLHNQWPRGAFSRSCSYSTQRPPVFPSLAHIPGTALPKDISYRRLAPSSVFQRTQLRQEHKELLVGKTWKRLFFPLLFLSFLDSDPRLSLTSYNQIGLLFHPCFDPSIYDYNARDERNRFSCYLIMTPCQEGRASSSWSHRSLL